MPLARFTDLVSPVLGQPFHLAGKSLLAYLGLALLELLGALGAGRLNDRRL